MCKYSPERVAAATDLAALKPEDTLIDTLLVCGRAALYHCASVCVKPTYVIAAARELRGTGVGVGTVINFPHGNSHPTVMGFEAYEALGDGATELDMVIDIGAALSGDWRLVSEGIEAVMREVREWKRLCKVILETCYLPETAIYKVCELCVAAGVDFVKTSTGCGTCGATPEAVTAMFDAVAGRCGVKASGGIKTYADAELYLDLGCTRLGSSKVEELFPC
ncbi:MAG: deoxyribose-phosphate aldolase [Planctomycetota bacterium]|jgi:deoxyribose-phosphate aldolase